ncbi:hypothetical protein D9758_002764 [Tetrapyrgos nigripes]|uniref:Major facilitator superfamily (MFS) profile domain-containing protein n=1 Tax=Tetrapyrgos nigripes TaxID=182062 RepID=A0A8H5GQW6_9AGAR|nr:hypothetical protein D9758_002764 [Tetrapyrgos nigripes]
MSSSASITTVENNLPTVSYRDSEANTSVPAGGSEKDSQVLTDQTNLLPVHQVILVFIMLSFVKLGVSLDATIVATSLTTLAGSFEAGSIVSWVPAAYLITSTAILPLYGRFSDIFGRKAVLCSGIVLFVAGNIAAGFATSIIQVIVFRSIAGAGGGGVSSMIQIIISDVTSLRERSQYVGLINIILTAGNCLGPVIGGALAQHVGWRWCFWINLPLAVITTAVALACLPLKPVEGEIKSQLMMLDYLGASLTFAACTCILLPLIWGGVTFPWTSPIVICLLVSSLLLTVLFCLWEHKGARFPIVPMYIFKKTTICGVYIAMFINGFTYTALIYYLPQFSQVAMNYSPTSAGVFLIPVLVGQMLSSVSTGFLVSRVGRYRAIIYSGFAVCAISCGFISMFTKSMPKAVMVVLMLIVGFGNGATAQTTIIAAQASVARKDMSVVTGFRNFIRMLGGAFALPIASACVNNLIKASMRHLSLPSSIINEVINDPRILSNPSDARNSTILSPSDATYILEKGYKFGFRDLFILVAALNVLATIISAVMIGHKDLVEDDEEELRAAALERLGKKDDSESGVGSGSEPKKQGSSKTGSDAESGCSSEDSDEKQDRR